LVHVAVAFAVAERKTVPPFPSPKTSPDAVNVRPLSVNVSGLELFKWGLSAEATPIKASTVTAAAKATVNLNI
jgi:hypothetical protein